VGTRLSQVVCQYLAHQKTKVTVTLIDGDNFEPKNADRQVFGKLGNKAEVTAERLVEEYPNLTISTKNRYVTEENAFVYIQENSVVFCCVDNHASRKLLSEHCAWLENAVLISGGNDYHDGNVQVFIREKGKNLTPPITYLHPEIAEPADKNPAELSCEELAATSSPQLIFANLKVATEMGILFWLLTERSIPFSELYFDLTTGAQRAINRKEVP
jgi:molybdopterin/thiamine biosynthesis adenylyltransferase